MTLTTSRTQSELRLPLDLRLTPEQFGLVCAENREAVLELDADGRLIAITPTGCETGSCNGELFFQLSCTPKRAAWLRSALPRSGGGTGQPQRLRTTRPDGLA